MRYSIVIRRPLPNQLCARRPLPNFHSLLFCRGVGCIFVEMLSGKALFPGIKGVYDQLNKIWNVSEQILIVLLRSPALYIYIYMISYLCRLSRFWAHPLRAPGLEYHPTQSISHVSYIQQLGLVACTLHVLHTLLSQTISKTVNQSH